MTFYHEDGEEVELYELADYATDVLGMHFMGECPEPLPSDDPGLVTHVERHHDDQNHPGSIRWCPDPLCALLRPEN